MLRGARTHKVERAVELDIGDRLLLIGDVDLRDRLIGLVLQRQADVAVEGSALGINVNGGVDSRDLGLEEVLVLFELRVRSQPGCRGAPWNRDTR